MQFTRNGETNILRFHFVNIGSDNRFYIIKNDSKDIKDKYDYMTVDHIIKLRNFLNKILGDG